MLSALRRLCHRSRAFWVGLLLLTFLWQPTLLAASEVHEAEHAIQTGHDHHAEADGLGIPADEPSSPEDASLWHGLLHLGHCCAYPQAVPNDGMSALTVLRPASAPFAAAQALPSLTLPRPLRPPIQA